MLPYSVSLYDLRMTESMLTISELNIDYYELAIKFSSIFFLKHDSLYFNKSSISISDEQSVRTYFRFDRDGQELLIIVLDL
jgi:hypothetical protein